MLAVLGGTGGADDRFLDDLLALPARIIRVVLLAFASLGDANHRVGLGTVRVLLAAPLQDQVLARSPRWHDALTQLTAIHDPSQETQLRVAHVPSGLYALIRGGTEKRRSESNGSEHPRTHKRS